MMPILVKKKLESLRIIFFLGKDNNGSHLPWISWDLVLATKERGNLELEVLRLSILLS